MLSPKETFDFELLLLDLLDSWKVNAKELDDVREQLMEIVEIACHECANLYCCKRIMEYLKKHIENSESGI